MYRARYWNPVARSSGGGGRGLAEHEFAGFLQPAQKAAHAVPEPVVVGGRRRHDAVPADR